MKDQLVAFNTLKALAAFHCLTKEIEPISISTSILNFHNTPNYLREYEIELVKYKSKVKNIDPDINKII